jgi:hypothetical protein
MPLKGSLYIWLWPYISKNHSFKDKPWPAWSKLGQLRRLSRKTILAPMCPQSPNHSISASLHCQGLQKPAAEKHKKGTNYNRWSILSAWCFHDEVQTWIPRFSSVFSKSLNACMPVVSIFVTAEQNSQTVRWPMQKHNPRTSKHKNSKYSILTGQLDYRILNGNLVLSLESILFIIQPPQYPEQAFLDRVRSTTRERRIRPMDILTFLEYNWNSKSK